MNYIIKYTVKDTRGVIIESKEMRVKNKPNEFMAKVSLEVFLKKKLVKFHALLIHSCEKDMGNNIFDILNKIVKK